VLLDVRNERRNKSMKRNQRNKTEVNVTYPGFGNMLSQSAEEEGHQSWMGPVWVAGSGWQENNGRVGSKSQFQHSKVILKMA